MYVRMSEKPKFLRNVYYDFFSDDNNYINLTWTTNYGTVFNDVKNK